MPRKPTLKQTKALQFIAQGHSAYQAMIKAGYSPASAKNPSQNLLESRGYSELADEMELTDRAVGLTPLAIAKATKELLEAKKVTIVGNGEDAMAIDTPDFQAKAKGISLWQKRNLELRQKMSTPLAPLLLQDNRRQVAIFTGTEFSHRMREVINEMYAKQGKVAKPVPSIKPEEVVNFPKP